MKYNTIIIILAVLILLSIFFTTTLENFFVLPNQDLKSIAGSSGECSTHCTPVDQKTGLPTDPYGCCQCKSGHGVYDGNANEDDFRKCMCNFGSGYESYCYKLTTNFLLSQ